MGAATSGVYSVADELVDASDAVAFDALYREHAAFTWSCLRRLGVPAAAVDDAMQELWVTAHRRIDTLRSRAVSKSWLFGIARRIASHSRRTEQRHRRRVDAFGEQAASAAEPERESSLVVESILASLDERVREAFVLSELEGWSASEISAATGANTNTIYWRVRTARHQLQAQLAEGELDARVIALRDGTKAPRKSITHCWMIIAPQLTKPAVTGGLFGLWSVAKVAVLTTIGATATVVVATGIDVGAGGVERSPVAIIERAEPASARQEVVAAGVPVAAAVLPAAAAISPAFVAAAPKFVAPETVTRPYEARAAVRGPSVPPPIVAADVHDIAAEEASLLAALKTELAGGRTSEATALLQQHRDRFPTSALADVRAAISIELSCVAGDPATGRAELTTWRTRLGATKAARLDSLCGPEDAR